MFTNVFAGGTKDTDSDVRLTKTPNFRKSLNMRNGKGIELGAMENALGNAETNYHTLPVGTNKIIGKYEDATENTLFYFLYNSNGTHQIIRHYPSENRSDVLAQGSALNFHQDHYIHSVHFVDRKYLYWTDAFETATGLEGNEPRKLNVVKASLYQKKYAYEFHFALDDQFNYTTLNGQTLNVGIQGITFNSTTAANRAAVINHIFNQINTGTTYVASTQGSTLIITHNAANTTFVLSGASVSTWGKLIPNNFYTTSNISDVHLSWAKAQPQYAPTVSYTVSPVIGKSKRSYAQYCVRYIYDDGEKSAWGAFSITPYIQYLTSYDTYKALIDFYDERLNDTTWLTIIKKVEIGVRYGNTQSVVSIATLQTSEIGFVTLPKNILTATVNSNHYSYIENNKGLAVGSDDNTSDNEVQVLKPYDHIPQLAHTISMVSDENGSTLALVSNTVRGYDNIRADVSISITEETMYDSANSQYFQTLPKYVSLKPNEQYKFGIVYYDKYGRSSAVQYISEITTTKKYCITNVQFTVKHLPPSWATSWQLVRTKGLSSDGYKIYAENGQVVHNLLGDYTEWTIPNLVISDEITATNIAVYFNSEKRSEFNLINKGDRLKIWQTADSNIVYDLEIEGYKIDSAGTLIILTRVVPFTLVEFAEVYNPSIEERQFYFETGMKLPVTNGFHIGSIQNQTVSQPAIINLIGGDVKWDFGRGGGVVRPIHSREYYRYEYDEVVNEDIGRINIIDENAKKEWFKNEIRFSESYNLHSKYNGLSAFRSLDYIEINNQYGSIQKLENALHSVIAICQYKIQPIYVNRDRMLDFQGNQSVGRTNRILNIAEPVINNWGTRNPESVLNIDGRIYAWDSYNGIFWRFSQDGQTNLSAFDNSIEHKALGRERMAITRLTDKIITGYEIEHNTIYISFSGTVSRNAFTIGYEDMSDTEGWKDEFSFVPEMFGKSNGVFFSFKDGKMYRHGVNVVSRCNFYGTQYNASITFAVNGEPKAIKTPTNFAVQSNNCFICPLIEVQSSNAYPNGQKSRILQTSKWKRQEGKYYAEIMKDYLDDSAKFTSIGDTLLRQSTALLTGRDLKFEAMLVTLQASDPTIKNRIYSVDTEYFYSENTKA